MTPASPGTPAVGFFDLPLAAIAGSAREALVLLDAQQRIVALNEAASRMFGYTRADVLGRPLALLIPEEQRAAHAVQVQEFAAAGQGERRALSHPAMRGLRADGQVFALEVAISRIEWPVDGQPHVYYVAMLRDLSVERDLRAEVGRLNARLRSVLDQAPVAIWIVDEGRVVYANRASAGLFGVEGRAPQVGQPVEGLLQAPGQASLWEHLALAARDAAAPFNLAGTLLRPDGQRREVEIAITALPDHGHQVVQMVIIDVTESRLQAQEQARHRLELRQLAASVVEAREEERRRIARELHDELGQHLTALKMGIAGLRTDHARADARGHIAGMLEMVDRTVAALRRIAADLRPLMLDDLGLNAAIDWLARDAARRLDVEVKVHLGDEDPPLAPGADIALYRMVQEALTNVGRHAHATEVRIDLRQDGGDLVLTVRDNGRGFPERSMRQAGRYGLLGIRERAIMLGGRLDVDNPPGGGGRITVRVPLKTVLDAAEAQP